MGQSLSAPKLDSPKKRRGRPSKHALKREGLILEATRLFNAKGIAAIGLADLARHLNLSRASVYHYVDSRSDLVFQCYQRSCEQMADDLLKAASESNGFTRLSKFIALTLTPDRSPTAVLSEVNALDEQAATLITASHNRNMRQLRMLITDGVKDGSIRTCDTEIIAQSIYGILSWSQLISDWSKGSAGNILRARTSLALIDLLEKGVAQEANTFSPYHGDIQPFLQKPGNPFDKVDSSEAKIEAILSTASRLFNQNSISATSLDEIAEKMGVTKGVIYHYFEHKDALVLQCYERAFDLYEQFIQYAGKIGENGLQSVIINANLNIQAKITALSPLMPEVGFSSLPDAQRNKFKMIANRQNKEISNFLKTGFSDGSVRNCDAGLITHICAGAFAWAPKWLAEADSRPTPVVANEICEMIFAGISTK